MANWPYCWPWPVIRTQILERDHHLCQIRLPGCVTHATHVDHIIPWSEGGAPYEPSNLRAACQPCNTRRANTRRTAIVNLNTRTPPTPSRQW